MKGTVYGTSKNLPAPLSGDAMRHSAHSLAGVILSLVAAALVTLGLCWLQERIDKRRAAERIPLARVR